VDTEVPDRYRRLVELSPDGILISQDNRIVFVNPAAVRLFGASTAEQVVGRSPFDVFHADSHALIRRRIARMMAGEPVLPAEEKIVRLDGGIRDVEVNSTRLEESPGETIQVIVRDISARKRAEALLRESEERLTLAFAGAQEGVWDWNLETGAVVYSPRWRDMLGYAAGELAPHVSAWERLLHPDDQPRAAELNERLAQGAGTYEGEFRLRHKDGHYIHVLSRGFPVRSEATGRVVHRRHASRHHRTEAHRSGPPGEPGAAHAGIRRRARGRLGLEHRDQRGGVFVAVEADARLRRRRNRAAHQRVGASGAS